VADAVGCEVAVFEVESGFFGDFAEDAAAEGVLVVPIALLCEPECILPIILRFGVAFFLPFLEDRDSFWFQRDNPVFP
jgi:hypothetical protein